MVYFDVGYRVPRMENLDLLGQSIQNPKSENLFKICLHGQYFKIGEHFFFQ